MNVITKKVNILYQNHNCKIIYAWCMVDPTKKSDVIKEYMKQRYGVIPDIEYNELELVEEELTGREILKFTSIYEMFEVVTLCDCLYVTKYEKEMYLSEINKWYNMYKDVIIASQLLPSVIGDTEKTPINQLNDIGTKLYESIDSIDSFIRHLRTSYITKRLLMHPLTALNMFSEEDTNRRLFQNRMFESALEDDRTIFKNPIKGEEL